ncbi:MAG: LptF/LptG family permease [Bacteroidia bacterium]|nr:LptF/LptG family permease [Bacteroidia bacterium]
MLKSFIGPWFISFIVTLFILVIQFLSKYKGDIFGKGLGAIVILKLFFYASIQLAVLALPISVMISSLSLLGKMGENYELAAIKAAGISLFRILTPLFFITTLLSLASFALTTTFIPQANLKLYSLLWDAQQSKPALALRAKYFNSNIDKFTIYFSEKKADSILKNIIIWNHVQNRGNIEVLAADSATMNIDLQRQTMCLRLYQGQRYLERAVEPGQKQVYPLARATFDTLRLQLDLSDFGLKRSDEKWFISHHYMQNLKMLSHSIDSLQKLPQTTLSNLQDFMNNYLNLPYYLKASPNIKHINSTAQAFDSLPSPTLRPIHLATLNNLRTIKDYLIFIQTSLQEQTTNLRKYQIEYHLKFTLPLACILLLFIGAPLGAIIRKGGLGVPTIVSILFFVIFYALMSQGRKLAREGVIEPWLGVWMPIFIMLPMALYVTYQSATDSRLLDLDSWRYLGQKFWKQENNKT